MQTFRKVIGEGSIGRVHLGRWQETDVAIKVLGKVMPQSSMPTAAPLQTTTGQMSAIDEGASSEDEISDVDDELLNEDMALTVKTLEREVRLTLLTLQSASNSQRHMACLAAHLQAQPYLKACSWQRTMMHNHCLLHAGWPLVSIPPYKVVFCS